MSHHGVPVQILLVEDNPADARLTREALKDGKLRNALHHVEDGVEAMAFLRQEEPYRCVPPPDLILLDLNLPRKDGRELLAEIKADEELKRIPVIVLTTSSDEGDILRSYNLHANCFITKPGQLEHYFKVVHAIEEFWLSVVRLPSNASRSV
jgi:two-component system, chemotaxis family, response regulator Rcp1